MKRILMSLLVIGAVAAMITGGTFAYFSDTVNSTSNTFTAGTLTLDISNNGTSWEDTSVTGTWQSPTGWAPGQSFSSIVQVKNTGSLPATVLGTDWKKPTGTGMTLVDGKDLSDYIIVTELKETIPGFGEYNDLPNFASIDANSDGQISLKELSQCYISSLGEGAPFVAGSTRTDGTPMKSDDWGNGVGYTTDSVIGGGYAPPGVAIALPAGGTGNMIMTFKLLETTPNGFQDKSLSMDITITAGQLRTALP